MIYITIIKTQGENRELGTGGKPEATQRARYMAAIHDADRHPRFFSRRKPSVAAARRDAESIFGPIEWHGHPDYLGFENCYGAARIVK